MRSVYSKLFLALCSLAIFSATHAQKVVPGAGLNNRSPKPGGMLNNLNNAANATLLTPTGYGSQGAYFFADAGGTPAATYGSKEDAMGQVGFGIGDYKKSLSVSGFVTINDASGFDNFSYNFIAARALGKNSSVSVGATHLFADEAKSDGVESYYIAFSTQSKKMRAENTPILSYTLGYGNGRFLLKSERDLAAGREGKGTGVFGSISYAASKNIRVNTEWTGLNLAVSSAFNFKPGFPSLYVGVTDLTRNTGDKPVLMFALGETIRLGKK